MIKSYDKNWHVTTRRRYKVAGEDGNWKLYDGIHEIGWAATRQEILVLRRRMEAGKR